MYLYDSNKKEIKVYVFRPKDFGQDLIDFKKEEMKKIDESRRVIKVITNVKDFPLHRDNLKSEINYNDINYVNKKFFRKIYHYVENYKSIYDYDYYSTLDAFYDGIYVHSPIITVKKDKTSENWIMTQASYLMDRDNYVLDGIINIPNTLRELRELEAGNFSNLTNEQIKKYSELFIFRKEPIAVYNKTLIRDLEYDGVVETKITNDILKRDAETIKRLSKIYK